MSQITTVRRPWETITFSLAALLRSLLRRWGAASASPAVAQAVARGQAELLSLVFAVCAAVLAIKGFIAYSVLDNPAARPQIFGDSVPASLARVGACCAEDCAVGLGCFLVAAAALRCRNSSWWRGGVRVLAHLAAVFALCGMVANAQVFLVTHHFLTYHLIVMGGGLHWDRSISEHITATFKLALALVPTVTLAFHLWTVWAFPRFWRAVTARAARPLALVAALLVLAGVTAAARGGLVVRDPRDYPRNPHLHFVCSLFGGGATFTIAEVGDSDEFEELLPGRPGHTPGLLKKPPRNVIVIAAESVGARWLEAYGSPVPTTPCLRRLEAEGKSLTFDNFYATCNHTIASALPIVGGMYNDPGTYATVVKHPDFPTPGAPAWLQQQGYTTCFFASGGSPTWEGYRNLSEAFSTKGLDVARDPSHPFWQEKLWKGEPNSRAMYGEDYLDDATFDDLRRAVRKYRDHKFAMWLWTYDTHDPYYDGRGPRSFPREHFPPAVLASPAKERDFQTYLRAIWRLDCLVGELYAELEELDLADDTLIVVTGDHGEEFGERGLWGHNWSVYDEEVRVPCVLINPGLAALGRRSQVVGSHVDLWATITDACALPCDPRWQGRSLVSGPAADRHAYFYRPEAELGVREGRWKYVWDYKEGPQRLFDMEADPTEQNDLAGDNAELCAAFRRRVLNWAGFQAQLTKERLAEVRK